MLWYCQKQTHATLKRLTGTKGREYRNGDPDVHANFNRLQAMLGIDRHKVLMVFATKHWDSIGNYIRTLGQDGAPALSEPIDGRIDDIILYMLLLKAMIRDGYNRKQPGEVTYDQ